MTEDWDPAQREALRALATEVPPTRGSEERAVASLRGEGLLPRGAPPWRRLLSVAAGLALFAVGALVQQRAGVLPAPQDERPRFLILLHSDRAAPPLPEAEARERVREYRAWAGRLARAGHLVEAEKLAEAEYALGGAEDAAPTGPAPSGFFLIAAARLEEAISLAKASPHLRYGGRLVVRPVERAARE